MLARIVIWLALLSFFGSYGCSQFATKPIRRGANAAPRLDSLAVTGPPESATSEAQRTITDTLPEPGADQETVRGEPDRLPDLAGNVKLKEELREDKESPSARTSGGLQNARGPRVDDGFLDLVERDLNKAFEQPVQQRRLQFSKEVVEHPRVRHFIDYFAKSQRQHFQQALARSGKYFPMIAAVLRDEGLPEELAYLALIESEFSPQAVSPSGAAGLWQFIPSTARKYGLKINKWVDERRDPAKSTRAAAAYLKDLHEVFGRWYLATAAYNAGQGAISRAMQRSGAKDFWSLSRKAKLREETRNFVPKFVAASLIAADPKRYGFKFVVYETPLEYEEVKVGGNSSLTSLATMAGTDTKVIRELNPELLRNRIPPGATDFRLKLPAGRGDVFVETYPLERNTSDTRWVTHEVKKGDTLFAIARHYGQRVRSLMEINGLASSRLQIGQKLRIFPSGMNGGVR